MFYFMNKLLLETVGNGFLLEEGLEQCLEPEEGLSREFWFLIPLCLGLCDSRSVA
jgi:hypothetical protein